MSEPEEPEVDVIVLVEQKPLFELGETCMTQGASEALLALSIEPVVLFIRHVSGDWGDMPKSDKAQNDKAVKKGEGRIFSAYSLTPEIKVWVITECDRSYTTILLPEEY
jgi:hypothetical protein